MQRVFLISPHRWTRVGSGGHSCLQAARTYVPLLLATLTLGGCFASSDDGPGAGECSPECGDGLLCIDATCRAPCATTSDCADTEACLSGGCATYTNVACSESDPCIEGFRCDSEGICVRKGNPGTACTSGEECVSSVCADGVCCATPCNGACFACSAALTGGADGRCVSTSAGLDPRDECPGVTTCDGNSRCTFEVGENCSENDECQSGFCVDGVCCETACDGTCVSCAAELNGGADGVCSNSLAGVETDDECAGPTACAGDGTCFAKPRAATCAQDFECQSGFCSDGVCCESACEGSCEACNSVGDCVAVTNQDDADTCGPNVASGACPNGSLCTCDGAGSCRASGNETCAVNGDCASGSCYTVPGSSPALRFCCDRACDGPCETCGSDGICVGIADGQPPEKGACSGEARCDGLGQCHDTQNGNACANDFECVSGSCWQSPSGGALCCNADCTASACFSCAGGSAVGGVPPGSCATFVGDPEDICPGAAQCGGPGADGCWDKTGGEICGGNEECISGECCNGRCLFGWQEVPTPTTENLNDVYVASNSAAWAVGDNGTLLEFDGEQWTLISSFTAEDLWAIDGTGTTLVVAAGINGAVVQRRNGTWSAGPNAPEAITLIDVGDDLEVYGAGGFADGPVSSYFGRMSDSEWDEGDVTGIFQGLARQGDHIYLESNNILGSILLVMDELTFKERIEFPCIPVATSDGRIYCDFGFALLEGGMRVELPDPFGALRQTGFRTSVWGLSGSTAATPNAVVSYEPARGWRLESDTIEPGNGIDVSECTVAVVGDGGTIVLR